MFAWGGYTALRGGAGQSVSEPAPAAAVPTPGLDRILILGDSLGRGTGDDTGKGIGGNLEEQVPDAEIVNVAVNGSKTTDLLATLERPSVLRLAGESDVIIVSIGGNDLFRETGGPDRQLTSDDAIEVFQGVGRRVQAIVQTLRESAPEARIFVLGLYDPFRDEQGLTAEAVARWNAGLAMAFAGDPRITVVQTADLFVDRDRLSSDQFHPGAEAYALIARRIGDAIVE